LISLHQDTLSKKIYDSKQFENIVKILKSKGYDKVITNTIISGITAPLFKKYNFKIISLIHEMGMSIELYDMKQGGRDITMYSDKIIFPAEVVKEDFYNKFNEDQKKSIICPQGLYKLKEEIQLNYNKIYQKYNIPQNSRIIFGSGTADYRKGIDLFLLAAQKLITLEEAEEYHFIWAGKIYND
jgi:glycosyltransferase involved in cell wall biosynthesis